MLGMGRMGRSRRVMGSEEKRFVEVRSDLILGPVWFE
jgi:hypothetical protein